MFTLSETIIFFSPILIFVLIAIVVLWQIAITGEGKTRFLTIASFLIWIFLTLVYCVFTLSYLSPHVGGKASEYFFGVLVYGIIGLGLVMVARYGKRKLQ